MGVKYGLVIETRWAIEHWNRWIKFVETHGRIPTLVRDTVSGIVTME